LLDAERAVHFRDAVVVSELGVLEHVVPQQLITRFVPKFRPAAIALSCLLGLIFPMCECGIVPVMRRLLRKGLPLSCCVAYMMAGPVINPVVILSTVVAFKTFPGGWWVVGLRIGLAFVVAFITGCIVDRMHREYGDDQLRHWLGVFLKRFFANQFKRSTLPDGPKVGTISLSPRGDWRMPSDAAVAAWLADLDGN
jgi:uncharacterized membrane protein YraQ (UPF0718 family)